MTAPNITWRAVQRYMERVEPLPANDARAAIESHMPSIRIAADFGCGTVVLGNGARLVLEGDVVVTVLARTRIRRKRDWRRKL